MLTEDWMMRQVEALARSIAYLVFQKEDTAYTPTGAAEDAEIDELYRTLLEKVNAGDIGGAEDLLFAECARRRARDGIAPDVLVHFDTPPQRSQRRTAGAGGLRPG